MQALLLSSAMYLNMTTSMPRKAVSYWAQKTSHLSEPSSGVLSYNNIEVLQLEMMVLK